MPARFLQAVAEATADGVRFDFNVFGESVEAAAVAAIAQNPSAAQLVWTVNHPAHPLMWNRDRLFVAPQTGPKVPVRELVLYCETADAAAVVASAMVRAGFGTTTSRLSHPRPVTTVTIDTRP